MRAVVQRVDRASVSVNGETVGSINKGLVVLVGVGQGDTEKDADYLADKVVNMRIFSDECGKMNLSCLDIRGEILAVSQFTLFGDCRKGKRPSFTLSAAPDEALFLYEYFVEKLKSSGLVVKTGVFREEMIVEIHNHGPVTILLDSKKLF